MNRRNFIRNSSITGLSLTAVVAAGCGSRSGSGGPDSGSVAAPVEGPGAAVAGPAEFALNEATIDGLQQKMQQGIYTSRSITEMYLKRIDQIDKAGPGLHAVIEVNPDALAIADLLDKERKAGTVRGPMHGIPVLVKDNIDTGDKMMTTAGSLALVGHRAAQDAFIIAQLRKAGAVLLGKTNLSEWANFRSTRSTSGWSSRGRQTKCPYILDRNPSGSSAGSGSGASANLCTVAIGTETDGSVVSPSSVNGLVGIKPTVGLLSRSGIIPISATQDTAGPMARTVRDAAILLGALTGVDEKDAATKGSAGHVPGDYTKFLDLRGLSGKRIGIEKSYLKGHEGVVALYNAAIATLKGQGATVVEVELMKDINPLGKDEFIVLQYEFKDGLNKYLAAASAAAGGAGGGLPKSLADVIAFNKQHADTAMPYFQQETLESSQAMGGLDSKQYQAALRRSTSSRGYIDRLMKEHQLDAICSPTNGPACCIDLINGDYDTGFSFSSPAAMAGYPHITVPMGVVHGLPVGFSFIAGAYNEPVLLGMAYCYEQATMKRVGPSFVADVLS
ncbi:MAG TPA: amidase [Puia sp.]|nr:amidase [Puia sp.]